MDDDHNDQNLKKKWCVLNRIDIHIHILYHNNLHDDRNVVLPASESWNPSLHLPRQLSRQARLGLKSKSPKRSGGKMWKIGYVYWKKSEEKSELEEANMFFFRFKRFKIREFGGTIYWMFPESHLNVHGTIIYKWMIQLTKMLAKGQV